MRPSAARITGIGLPPNAPRGEATIGIGAADPPVSAHLSARRGWRCSAPEATRARFIKLTPARARQCAAAFFTIYAEVRALDDFPRCDVPALGGGIKFLPRRVLRGTLVLHGEFRLN